MKMKHRLCCMVAPANNKVRHSCTN